MKVVAITQARMNSSRLPGKVMREVLGRPLLAHHVERVRRARTLDEVIVATTVNPADDLIVAWCQQAGVGFTRGSENDVLSRYVAAAETAGAEIIVRITADCPVIDPAVIDRTVRAFCQALPGYDYACNRLPRTYPRGLDVEVLTLEALLTADREAPPGPDREHVTLFVWRQPERFRLLNVPYEGDESRHRWTVDTPADLELVSRMIGELQPLRPAFDLQDCLDCLSRHPDWFELNSQVEQKDMDYYRLAGAIDQWQCAEASVQLAGSGS